jgi:hypothetical protein
VISIIILLPFILFFTLLVLICFFVLRQKKKKQLLLPNFTDLIPKDATFEFYSLDLFRQEINSIRNTEYNFINKNVKSLYLVHGTFVGDDPWHLISLIETTFSGLSVPFVGQIKLHTKKGQNFFAKDLGNFTNAHNDEIEALTNAQIDIHHFTWSSANNHYARLQGCLDLIKSLALDPESRIMLIGHSHAGQVFALLTQLINNMPLRKNIILLLKKYDLFSDDLNLNLSKLKKKKFDFITLGAPARYNWNTNNSNMTLTHIINHRAKDVLGGNFSGAGFTKDGDYIQQWGIAGSDFKSPLEIEQKINIDLDTVFGPGTNLGVLQENIKLRKRLHNQGHHYLVDYGDQSKFPNFMTTIFGHGTYTKIENMDILLHIINTHLANK